MGDGLASGPSPCRGPRPVRLRRGRPRRGHRPAAAESGMTSLEMAILFPSVLLVILSMFQISLYWHTANAAAVAAEQGLDAGQIFPEDKTRAVDEARAAAQWILETTNHRNAVVNPTINGDLLTVTVTAEAPRIVGIGSWQVRSVAEGRFEAFIPAGER